ncbi:MAG: Elongation factor P--(R)-beta-lysine ligase [Verrucomicrobiota bacterium]|jgi:lysyl-tRNA synthetase class 2
MTSRRSNPESLRVLQLRSRLLGALRAFFASREFLEAETPLRLATPALEDHIDAIPAAGRWLRTSPELHLKRLLAAGASRIYQIGPCFRLGERSERHREEFTMLEWYEAPGDSLTVMATTIDLIRACSQALGKRRDYFARDPEILPLADAFRRHGLDLDAAIAAGRFEEELCFRIEPHLGLSRPCFITDYPASMAALARRKPGFPHLAERWELYVDGLELANAYGELTDPVEQRARFLATAELRRAAGRVVYPLDEDFLASLANLPPCGGIAFGIDRLLMALLGTQEISDVLSFPEE